MEIHHFGYACEDIESSLSYLKSIYTFKNISAILYDPEQCCKVCLVDIEGAPSIELVSGERVKKFVENQINLYHVCYEVDDLNSVINQYILQGCFIISSPKPAVLFDNRQVAFLQTPLGIVELLEKENSKKNIDRRLNSVVVSGNFTANILHEGIKTLCGKLDLNVNIELVPYNDLLQALANDYSVMNNKSGTMNLIYIYPGEWIETEYSEGSGNIQSIEYFKERAKIFYELLAQKGGNNCQYHVIYGPFPSWLKQQSETESIYLDVLNSIQREISYNNISMTLPSTLPFIEDHEEYFNAVTNEIAHIPYNNEMNSILAYSGTRIVYNTFDKRYKVVVVDCDYTLWYGLCGSDETGGIKMLPGYQLFQKKLVELHSKGILICLCSKNKEEDVLNVFTKNEGMILNLNSISAYKINWEEKFENLMELSQSLNIALDDFIFIDDSYVECQSVTNMLPQVLVINFPENEGDIKNWLEGVWAIHCLKESDFDQERTSFYKNNEHRVNIKKKCKSLKEFVDILEVKVAFKPMLKEDISRVSQLYSRVNQFTLNGIKYKDSDISEKIAEGDVIICVSVSDKFGDYGVVGVLNYKINEQAQMLVNSFLLSCRSLGRGVEHDMLLWLVKRARSFSCNSILIHVQETEKNIPAIKFINDLILNNSEVTSDGRFLVLNVGDIDNMIFSHEKIIFQDHENTGLENYKYDLSRQGSQRIHGICTSQLKTLRDIQQYVETRKSISFNKDPVNNQDYIISLLNEYIKTDKIDMTLSFIANGGESLAAVKFISQIYKDCEIQLRLEDVFNDIALSALIEKIVLDMKSPHVLSSSNTMAENMHKTKCLASYAQKMLWFHDVIDGGNSWYYNLQISIDFDGSIDIPLMKEALCLTIRQHEALCTTFKEENNELYQVLQESFSLPFEVLYVQSYTPAQIKALKEDLFCTEFKLGGNELLLRASLLVHGDSKYSLVVIIHHIIFDGMSYRIFLESLSNNYNRVNLKEGIVQKNSKSSYRNFTINHNSLIESGQLDQKFLDIEAQMQNIESRYFPSDYSRGSRKSHAGKFIPMLYGRKDVEDIRKFSIKKGCTIYQTMLLVFGIVIGRHLGTDKVIITSPVSGRPSVDYGQTIGCFTNLVIQRLEIDYTKNFDYLLSTNRDQIISKISTHEIPFVEILERFNLYELATNSSIFQIMLSMQPNDYHNCNFNNTQSKVNVNGYNAARLEIIMELEECDDSIEGGIYYSTDLFKQERIELLINEFKQLLKSILNGSNAPIIELYKEILGTPALISSAYEYEASSTKKLIDQFYEMVEKYPEKIAIRFIEHSISYTELDFLSNSLSSYFISRNISAGSKIAIIMPPSYWQIIIIVSCIKVGICYVPLDHRYPESYLNNILSQLKPELIVSKMPLIYDGYYLFVDELSQIASKFSKNPKLPSIDQETIAYIIFTSGTTGNPKGVEIPIYNISDLISSTKSIIPIKDTDIIPMFHSIAFDFSVWEVWMAISHGATLVILPDNVSRNTQDFVDIIITNEITAINQTPTAFRQLIRWCLNNNISNLPLQKVILGGEKVNPKEYIEWHSIFDHVQIFNLYGITENTVHTTCCELTLDIMLDNRSNIGLPLPGKQIAILDENLNPVPEGFIGEMYVAGQGLARGYFSREDLTNKSFIYLSIGGSTLRMYKTGDLARYYNKALEYIGRRDNQKKIRGYRIELEGIKAILNEHPGIAGCEIANIPSEGNEIIVCYVIPDPILARPINKSLDCKEKIYVLPNDLTIFHINQSETDFLYKEIFDDLCYENEMLSLNEAPVIIDVGANIGIFSLQQALSKPKAKIYAFEPMPEIFSILQKNIELYDLNVQCFNWGLSSKSEKANFDYYPNASIFSGVSRDHDILIEDAKHYLNSVRVNDTDNIFEEDLDQFLKEYLEVRQVPVVLKTLSEFIIEHNLKKIDLIKIDAESMEWVILQGIDDEHWPFIENCIVEIRDDEGCLEKYQEYFESKGFKVRIGQSRSLENSKYHTLYALRNFSKAESVPLKEDKKYLFTNQSQLLQSIKDYCLEKLPAFMNPVAYRVVNIVPMNINGKIDYTQFLEKMATTTYPYPEKKEESTLDIIMKIWREVTNNSDITPDDNFFYVGGNSLLILKAHNQLKKGVSDNIKIVDIFNHPTAKRLSNYLDNKSYEFKSSEEKSCKNIARDINKTDIAIIGYSGVFPKSANVDEYWSQLVHNVNCLTTLTKDEAKGLGVPDIHINNHAYIPVSGMIDEIDLFDAGFFNISSFDACSMDPQFRLALEHSWQSLNNAGYSPENYSGRIGVSFGMGHPYYSDRFIHGHHIHTGNASDIQVQTLNYKDYLANRIAYHLDLSGSAINVGTSCSTSLTAIIKGCDSLLNAENDMVIAGGVSLILPDMFGYLSYDQSILANDGKCRPFDADSSGTVPSSGVGVVVLKRLENAIQDGDDIKAIIKGYAINNDGQNKLNFVAPSMQGQINCLRAAIVNSKIDIDSISYIEAHGTGTRIGDAIEVEALSHVFRERSQSVGKCIIGASKSNIGHADVASGVAGLLKVVMMLKNKKIPGTLHFNEINEHINLDTTPFEITSETKAWKSQNNDYYAGISSFGIGGTNCHIVLKNYVETDHRKDENKRHVIALSAPTPEQLTVMRKDLASYIDQNSNRNNLLEDISYTLISGRSVFRNKSIWIVKTPQEASLALREYPHGNIQSLRYGDNVGLELIQISKSWLNGELSLKDRIKHRGSKKISLPEFPFNKKSYWYSDNQKSLSTNGISQVNVENFVISSLRDMLNQDSIPITSNIFDFGINSLDMLRFVDRFEKKFAVNLDIDQIYTLKYVGQIIKYAESVTDNIPLKSITIKELKAGDVRNPVVIIHPIGGALHHFQSFIELYNGKSAVYGIQNIPSGYPDPESIQAVAGHYLKLLREKLPNSKLILVGWSMGGNIAWEMAHQLIKQGCGFKRLVLIDSWAYLPQVFSSEEYATSYFITNQSSELEDWMKVWSEQLSHRLKMLVNYKPSFLNQEVVLFKATQLDKAFEGFDDKANYWAKYCATIGVEIIHANHHSIVQTPNVKIIADFCTEISRISYADVDSSEPVF